MKVFSVPVLDFESVGQVDGGNVAARLHDRMEMIHMGVEGLRSHAWERLFSIEEPLVKVLMLEFFNTVHYRETDLGMDTVDTLVFRLGGVARGMSMRQFVLAMGLHTEEELGSAGFDEYWAESMREVPDNNRGLLGEDFLSGGSVEALVQHDVNLY